MSITPATLNQPAKMHTGHIFPESKNNIMTIISRDKSLANSTNLQKYIRLSKFRMTLPYYNFQDFSNV